MTSVPTLEEGKEYSLNDVMGHLLAMQPLLSKLSKLDDIEKQLTEMKDENSKLKKKVKAMEDRESKVVTQCNDAIKKLEIKQVNSEYNSKQYNVFIHNIPEAVAGKETPEKSRDKVYEVLKDVLKVE